MRGSVTALVLAASMSAALAIGACSSAESSGDGDPDAASGSEGGPGGPDATGDDDSSAADGGGGDANANANDGATNDGAVESGVDAAIPDAATPAVQFVGRFDEGDPAGFRMAWPGTRVVANFDGTDVTVRLSLTHAGFQGAPSWFNVVIDDVVQAPFSVSGAGEDHVLAAGLPPGKHKVEIEKRTEANHGTVRFEGFTFAGGTGLEAPPPRPPHRVEFISESTIDGFGVEGDRSATCIGTAPAEFDNVRKSLAFYTALGVDAEPHITAYSGKGLSKNNSAGDALTMPLLFDRALPDPGAGTAWTHAKWVPDAIVISLGGVDYGAGVNMAPADFETKYAAFVAKLRTVYGNAPYVFLTVWSQIKDLGGNDQIRTPVTAALDGVVTARKALGDNSVSRFSFPEAAPAVETGCYYHANDAHHQAMAALLVAEMKTKIPGW